MSAKSVIICKYLHYISNLKAVGTLFKKEVKNSFSTPLLLFSDSLPVIFQVHRVCTKARHSLGDILFIDNGKSHWRLNGNGFRGYP